MGYEIVQISKEQDEQAWLDFREGGIGGSEIGTIMGVNPWKSAIELFYQKSGAFSAKTDYNTPMFMGNILEPIVADLFEFWDDGGNLIHNYVSGLRQRKLYEVDGYVLNSDYPNMFFSPDRLIADKPVKRMSNLIHKNIEGIVEIKTISNWSAKQWEGGMPPSYYLQLQTYLMGLDVEEGYLVSLKDGRDLDVLYIERNREVGDMIFNEVQEFWQRVELAREDPENVDQYAPDPDGTQSLENFLKEKFKNPEENTILADDKIVELAKEHIELSQRAKEVEEQARERSNAIKMYMGENSILDLGKNGRVTWRQNSRGIRIFKNLFQD